MNVYDTTKNALKDALDGMAWWQARHELKELACSEAEEAKIDAIMNTLRESLKDTA